MMDAAAFDKVPKRGFEVFRFLFFIYRWAYIYRYKRDHPDYVGLFNSGKLSCYLDAGLSGEAAYSQYHIDLEEGKAFSFCNRVDAEE